MALPVDVGLPLLLLIAGIGLAIAEAIAPGAHFIVLGVALFVAGLIGLLFPPLGTPLALAVLVLAAGGLALYGYREFDVYGGKGTARTTDSGSLQGMTGRVTERITASSGQIKIEGGGFNPYYSARNVEGEIPVGAEVFVVDPGGGNVLTVEALSAFEDDIDRELAQGRAGEDADSAAEPDDGVATDAESDLELERESDSGEG